VIARTGLALALIFIGCSAPPRPVVHDPPPVRFFPTLAIEQVSLGWDDLCARLSDGQVVCEKDWSERPGQSGFVRRAALGGAEQMSLSRGHGCAVLASGAVGCWGDNTHQQLGAAEPETIREVHVIEGFVHVAEVRVGDAATCARTTDGHVECVGALGVSHQTNPTPIHRFERVVDLALGGANICARTIDGEVLCLDGRGHTVRVSASPKNAQLSVGRHFGLIRDVSGTVSSFVPPRSQTFSEEIDVTDDAVVRGELDKLSNIRKVAAGERHACALDAEGAVWCWGENDYGQLGDGTRTSHVVPARVALDGRAEDLVSGFDRSCARLARTSEILCWGRDLLNDPMFHALTGQRLHPSGPAEADSLIPEPLRIAAP
jgi:alpha-tubulin suppressor-like RCC1 family protein